LKEITCLEITKCDLMTASKTVGTVEYCSQLRRPNSCTSHCFKPKRTPGS